MVGLEVPMGSFKARQTLKATARILALASLGAPCAGIAQAAFETHAVDQQQRQIVSKIRKIRSQDGPLSADLIDPLTALSLSYQERGHHDLAAAAINKARHLVRVNYGLHTVEEARLIWQEVKNRKAGGDVEGAWRLEQELLPLTRRHPDDLGIVPILRGVAEERLDILKRYRAGELPLPITLGCYYDKDPSSRRDPHRSCLGGSRDTVIRSLFTEARLYYKKAIGVLYRNRRYSSRELRDLEKRVIRISYSSSEYIHDSHRWYGTSSSDLTAGGLTADYREGRQSYRRLVGYGAVNSEPWLARIETFVEMADWDLLFSQHAGTSTLDAVVEAYQHAYDLLGRKNVAQTSIDEIFAPKVPVVLPAFLPNPLISKKTSESSGHIDIAFGISKYGRAEHIEVLDSTTNATRAAQKDLIGSIKRSNFRPRVVDGRVVDGARVSVRYYLNGRGSATSGHR